MTPTKRTAFCLRRLGLQVFLLMCFSFHVYGLEIKTLGFYRMYYTSYRSTLFNPDRLCTRTLNWQQGPHYSLALYLSVQGDFLSCHYQMDLLGSVFHENKWDAELDLPRFYLQKDFGNWVLVAGRALYRWGTGYAFNPTDVTAPDKDLADPENNEKRSIGSDMIKLEYFGESYSLALAWLTRLQVGSRIEAEGSRIAFRLYKNLWDVDFSLIALIDRDNSPIFGGNFAFVLGERLEIHGEASTQKGCPLDYHRTIADSVQLYSEDPFSALKRNQNRLFCQILFGFQYTFPGNILWISEYYHQDQGYSRDEWHEIIDYAEYLNDLIHTTMVSAAQGNLLWTLNVFSHKGAMRDYWMHYLSIPVSKHLQTRIMALVNLSDWSYMFIPEIQIRLGNHFTLYSRSFIFHGKEKTEFGEFFQSCTIEGGIRFQ
jgi:hypothetical protein